MSGLLLSLLFVSAPLSEVTSDELRKIFQSDEYAFCHDETRALLPFDREYCEVVTGPNSLCPALPKVCQNEPSADLKWVPKGRVRIGRDGVDYGSPDHGKDGGGKSGDADDGGSDGDGTSAGGDGGELPSADGGQGKAKGGEKKKANDADAADASKKKKAKKKPPPEPPDPPEPLRIPGWLAMIARVLFYLLCALLLGGLVFWIYKNLIEGRGEDQPAEGEAAAPADHPVAAPVVRGPVETDVDRLLRRAEAAASRGDFKAAIEDSYAALLRRLEGDGSIHLHPSRTNGDYVRSLGPTHDAMKPAMRAIVSDVERVQFGTEPPSRALFDSVWRRVLPLVGKAIALFALLSGLGSAVACDAPLSDRRSPKTLAILDGQNFGKTPSGLHAVVEFLETLNFTVEVAHPKEGPSGTDKTIVLLPGSRLDADEWKRLGVWMRGGGRVVAFGYHEVFSEWSIGYQPSSGVGELVRTRDYWGGDANLKLPHAGALTLPRTSEGAPRSGYSPLIARRDPKEPRTFQDTSDEVYALSVIDTGLVGRGAFTVFADDRLFANVALVLGSNSELLREVLSGTPRIEIWDDQSGRAGTRAGQGSGAGDGESQGAPGGGAKSPLDSMSKAHLLPILLQLFALVLLFLLYRGVHFGRPRDPRSGGRRAFADHARALGLSYAKAGADRFVTGVYSVWALERLRERFLGRGARGVIPLAEAISRKTGRPLGDVMEVLTEAGGARDDVAPPSSFRPTHGYTMPNAKSARPRFWVLGELAAYLSDTKPPTPSRKIR